MNYTLDEMQNLQDSCDRDILFFRGKIDKLEAELSEVKKENEQLRSDVICYNSEVNEAKILLREFKNVIDFYLEHGHGYGLSTSLIPPVSEQKLNFKQPPLKGGI